MSRAFVFPGQGSQAVGMGKDLAAAFPAAREVFQEVDEALKQNLSALMFEGPEADLTLTENAQPALMAMSVAVLRVLEKEGNFRLADKASFVAGHSLGEYSALAAAGAFSLADAARLLKVRGQAMQKAVPVGVGAMAALLGAELPLALEVAAEAQQDIRKVIRPVCIIFITGRDLGFQEPRFGGRVLPELSAVFPLVKVHALARTDKGCKRYDQNCRTGFLHDPSFKIPIIFSMTSPAPALTRMSACRS